MAILRVLELRNPQTNWLKILNTIMSVIWPCMPNLIKFHWTGLSGKVVKCTSFILF